MEKQQVREALTRISDTFGKAQYRQSLGLARALKQTLLQEQKPDPLDLGWARFYEFKSLYELEAYQEAYDLLNSNEPACWAVVRKNAAYMYSVGSELAMHLGLPNEVVRWGKRCLASRLDDDDRVSAAQCANTVCVLLARLERDELNAPFARHLLAVGRQYGAERPLIAGTRFLAANVARSGDPGRMGLIVDALDELRAIDDPRFSDEAQLLVDQVISSDWYRQSVDPADYQGVAAESTGQRPSNRP